MQTYRIANNPKVDLKKTMHKAFNKAHPDWKILEVDLRKQGLTGHGLHGREPG